MKIEINRRKTTMKKVTMVEDFLVAVMTFME